MLLRKINIVKDLKRLEFLEMRGSNTCASTTPVIIVLITFYYLFLKAPVYITSFFVQKNKFQSILVILTVHLSAITCDKSRCNIFCWNLLFNVCDGNFTDYSISLLI